MRYFHRTSLPVEQALAAADQFFAGKLTAAETAARSRTFRGTIGTIRITVQAEGGHYTLVTVTTDQVGESEADKLAKRFLATVHARVDERYALRGAY